MKTRTGLLSVIAVLIAVVSCTKEVSIEKRKELAKQDLLYRWGLEYYINQNHDTVFAKNTPCLQDDWIVFYAGDFGYLEQGECINYPGKEKEVAFHFEQLGISRWKLTSYQAGAYPNGQTWFSEGSNLVDLHGEGEYLYIVETSPTYQEWKYKKIGR